MVGAPGLRTKVETGVRPDPAQLRSSAATDQISAKRPLQGSLEVPTESCWNSVRKFQFPLDRLEARLVAEGSGAAVCVRSRGTILTHKYRIKKWRRINSL